MKRSVWLSILGAVFLAAVVAFPSLQPPKAKLTAKVLDEAGDPVPGARVKIFFDHVDLSKGLESVPDSGWTDSRGEYSGSGPTAGQTISGTAEKEGYYRGVFGSPLLTIEGHHWEPWNPIVPVTLHKIVHPIPMYAKILSTELPVTGEAAGFDLMKGDWVAPFGHGQIADMVFTLKKRFTSNRDYESSLTLAFSQPADGIQAWYSSSPKYASALRLPRLSPTNGYAQPITLSNRRLPGKFVRRDVNEQRSYFFRVRTVQDPAGKMVSALYGKIDGDILFSPIRSKTCSLIFTYYLNPTPNDPNVEFDPKRNLMNGLKTGERVQAP